MFKVEIYLASKEKRQRYSYEMMHNKKKLYSGYMSRPANKIINFSNLCINNSDQTQSQNSQHIGGLVGSNLMYKVTSNVKIKAYHIQLLFLYMLPFYHGYRNTEGHRSNCKFHLNFIQTLKVEKTLTLIPLKQTKICFRH